MTKYERFVNDVWGESVYHIDDYHASKGMFEAPCDDRLYYGLEIEIDGGGSGPKRCGVLHEFFRRAGIDVSIERDGSLEDGLEIVLQPLSIDAALGVDWEFFCGLARCLGYDHRPPTTGLHVHVSSAPLWCANSLFAFNIVSFMASNWRKLSRISQRRPEEMQWCRWNFERVCNSARSFLATFQPYSGPIWLHERGDEWIREDNYGRRYRALNLENDTTAELRVFKGILDPRHIRACIETAAVVAAVAQDACVPHWSDVRDFAHTAGYTHFISAASGRYKYQEIKY